MNADTALSERILDSSNAQILMKPDEVMSIIKKANSFNCKEALFTFGEHPDKTDIVMSSLEDLGFDGMLEYLYFLCSETLEKSGLLSPQQPRNTKEK